jgi:hypothetical protein
LSAMLTDAVSEPVVVGVNVTVMAQVEEAATLLQVLVSLKELALVPVMDTPDTVNADVPELVTVIVLVAAEEPTVVLAKVREVGERLTAGAVTVTELVAVADA